MPNRRPGKVERAPAATATVNAPAKTTNGRPKVAAAPGDEAGAAALRRTVAGSLSRLRRARRISLDDLSVSSGVSRAALSQIEGGRTNPTLAILWKVATGLDIPFQALLGTSEGERTRVLRADGGAPLRSADGRMESRLLSLAGASHDVDVYELRFSPKGALNSEPHAAGTSEIVVVLTGALRITTAGETYDLSPGDSISFDASLPHAYENTGSTETRCLDIVAYGQRS